MKIYKDMKRFQKARGMPFVKIGTRVETTYKTEVEKGVVEGYDMSMNLVVLLDGNKHADHYHPQWMIRYLDKEGNLIEEYGE